jgi:hypothetical protein
MAKIKNVKEGDDFIALLKDVAWQTSTEQGFK